MAGDYNKEPADGKDVCDPDAKQTGLNRSTPLGRAQLPVQHRHHGTSNPSSNAMEPVAQADHLRMEVCQMLPLASA